MAIQDSFNVSRALNSQSYAYKCWYNYNYGGNTMRISADDMNSITQTWSGELVNWKANAESDENAYEIEDDDYNTAVDSGKKNAQEKAGYEGGGKAGMATRAGVDLAVGAAGSLGMLTSAGTNVANKLGTTIFGNLGQKAAKEGAKEIGKDALKNTGSWSIAAPAALAIGTAYIAKKPNKDQKEACDALQDEMLNAQSSAYAAQDEMSAAGEEVAALSDEAQTYNEDTNEELEEQKTEFDMYKASYEELKAKIDSGEELTEEEKALMQELIPYMQELGVGMQDMMDETGDVVTEIYDEMGTYQDSYDYAAETIGEVQGLTDYAESFDEATKTSCYVEAAAQGLNAASGYTAGAKATAAASASLGFNPWAWACAAMGFAGGAMSTAGSAQQFKWAGEVGTEIDMREATQDLNADTSDIYDESIEGYEGSMETVEDFELEVPEELEEDMEALEEAPVTPEGGGTENGTTGGTSPVGTQMTGDSTGGGFGIPAQDDSSKKPEDEKDKK